MFFSLCILLDKDSDFELSEEISNEDSVSEGDDSDFDGETELKKTRGRGKSTTSSPAKPSVKPRTSVTGEQINQNSYSIFATLHYCCAFVA